MENCTYPIIILPNNTDENLGHPPFYVRLITTKVYATARGLQLPICFLDPRWQ